MKKELLMGNEAIALAALDIGVEFACGYPGTPSTEIIETIYTRKDENVYVEWSVNEKVALEVAAGAAYSGYRCLVTMKQVGLNACSDPIMNLSYIGVEGGLVIVVADDPGPISSQTEQDTRNFAMYSKLPLLDPGTPEEAYAMTQYAFELSEKYKTPVILRPTTRVCHSYAGVKRKKSIFHIQRKGFEKNDKWVCFPSLSYLNHLKVEKRFDDLANEFILSKFAKVYGSGDVLILASSVNFSYAFEAIRYLNIDEEEYVLFEASMIPLPEQLVCNLLERKKCVVVLEDLDAVVERYIYYLYAKAGMAAPQIYGKISGDVKKAGENTVDEIIGLLKKVFGHNEFLEDYPINNGVDIEPQKATLCAGCPHRASFYIVKKAMKNRDAIFCGDIGCYTLGKMSPLNMVDTCLCMGASITMGLGLQRTNPQKTVISFIGDFTFFHSGIPGVINGLYNNSKLTVIILDNSSTAMTGGQPTPEIGAIDVSTQKISIEQVLRGAGVMNIKTVSPFEIQKAIKIVEDTVDQKGIKVIIFREPCKKKSHMSQEIVIHTDKCNGCNSCITELGCPAMAIRNGSIEIDKYECNGCGLCVEVCKKRAIAYTGGKDE